MGKNTLLKYLKNKLAGIKREFTVPFNPQQNGVAEKKNKTIVEAARAMIFYQNLSLSGLKHLIQ